MTGTALAPAASISLDDLLNWSDHERARWRAWVEADPKRLALPFQPGERFATVGSVLAHNFLVERRHLCRLQGLPLPESTGVDEGDAAALLAYGDEVRRAFRAWAAAFTPAQAAEVMHTAFGPEQISFTRGKLALHVLLHEARHLAQLALVARNAGAAPPGRHDFIFFPGFE